jgi:two-component system sensor kinase FixL
VFNAIADGVIIADARGNLLDWNPAALRLHGFDNVDDVRQPLSHFTASFEFRDPAGGPPLPLEQWPLARALRREDVTNCVLSVARLDTGRQWVVSYNASWIRSDESPGASDLIVLTLRDLTPQYHAFEARAHAEAQLRELIESLPQLIWTCRPDGSCDYLSPQWIEYTGVPPEQHLGSGWLDALHPADRDRTTVLWGAAARDERPYDVEFRIRRFDGEYRWFRTRATPMHGADGRITRWIGTNTDVHDQRMAAEAIRGSETRFRRLANAMPQIVWSLAPDGRVTYLNEGWGKYTGLNDASPERVARVVHPEDIVTVRRVREEALRKGTPYEVEFRLRHASGGPYRWFLARGVPVTDDDGHIVEWFGTSTEIEDIKQAEASSRENEARLRGVLESAVEGIVTIDEHGTIQSVNPAVVQTFGYAGDEMIGRNVRMLMPDPFASEHDGYLARYLGTGERKIIGVGREVVGRRKDGSTFPVDLSVSEVRVGPRRIFTGIIRDITQRKAMEDQARERQAQVAHLERVTTIGQMATGLAHELNQPLGAIANYAKACHSLVESGKATPTRVAEMLAEVQSQAMRAGEIIHRLRAFVRKQQPKARPADANELVEETLRLLAFELRTSGTRIVRRFAGGLPQVLADHVQIGQVLVNLIRNAEDAMHGVERRRRQLTIQTARSADASSVTIAVTDNGCGVSPEHLPKLFDAFFTTKPDGLGVGLALCRTIVEDHGGQLTAEPNAVGGGMTFTLTLRAAGAAAAAAASPPPAAGKRLAGEAGDERASA